MKQALSVSTIIVLLTLFTLPAIAHSSGEMIIGYQVVLRIRSAAGGLSIQERVDKVTTRLNRRLGGKPFDPALITVRRYCGEYAVMHKNCLIVIADSKTAAYNKTSSEKLAKEWAANLKRVIPLAKAKTEGP